MRRISEYTEEDANSFREGACGSRGKRRDGLVVAKSQTRITGRWAFFVHVMHSVAFSEIYYGAVLINTEDGRRTAVKPITAKAGWEWSQFLMQSSRVRKP